MTGIDAPPSAQVVPDLAILQQALGLDEFGQGTSYRRHYVPGQDELQKCLGMVTLGLMERSRTSQLSHWFFVTHAGKEFVRANSPAPPEIAAERPRP